MKHSTGTSKKLVFAGLKAKGITATRQTVNGKRVWVTSDGREYESLAQLRDAYKAPITL